MRKLIQMAAMSSLLILIAAEGKAQSAADGFDPGTNGVILASAVQADGKILVGGTFSRLGGGGTGTNVRNSIARLNQDGTIDATFNPGANNEVTCMAVQADGKILVGGFFTALGGGGTGNTTRNYIARLNADGTLDATFNPGANDAVRSLAVQADGKILVGGDFTGLGGGIGTVVRNYIGRLNADGTLDATFNPGANDEVCTLSVQADGKILVGGYLTALGGGGTGTVVRNHIGRLRADGTLDTTFNPGANNVVFALTVQADGKILVGGDFTALGGGGTGTTQRNLIGRLNGDGALDTAFNPGADGNVVYVSAVQADDKVLVGGAFAGLGGGGGDAFSRFSIGRLYPNGVVDATFSPSTNDAGSVYALAIEPDGGILEGRGFPSVMADYMERFTPDGVRDASFTPSMDGNVYSLAVQASGGIVVGGAFTMITGTGGTSTVRNGIGRLTLNGGLDATFNPGQNGAVHTVTVQSDGEILVGGSFTMLGGGGSGTMVRNRIGRLNPDGTLDTAFNPGANDQVYALALQADGKILVGGLFTMLGGGGSGTMVRNHIGRLRADGTLDTTFNPGANGQVSTLVLQADGKILVGGLFTMLGGGGTGTTVRNNIGRLNADGTLDTTFDPGGNDQIHTLVVQADGKILVGGLFTMLGGGGTGLAGRNHIGRLNADGTLDGNFDPGANDVVVGLALQLDGKIVAGGGFTMLGGGGTGTMPRSHIGRLTNPDAALQQLGLVNNNTIINWSRSGASPELDHVTFEKSFDGVSFFALAPATRVAGGWQLSGQVLATQQDFFIRARGFYSTGRFDASGSIVESVRNIFITPPPTASQIVSRKTHGAAGSFDISLPLTGTPGVECRSGGASNDYEVVLNFQSAVTFTNTAITAGVGAVNSSSGNGTSIVTVNLTGVTNAQRITVTLQGVSDGSSTGDISVPMNILVGDTNGNGSVNSSDVSQTKLQSGQTVTNSNFREDVNANGTINSSDVSLVKLRSGTALP